MRETIGPGAIHRWHRVRSATVPASTPPGVVLGDAVARLERHLRQTLPPGADYELAGQAQLFEESFYYLSIVLLFSVVFIDYLVLAALLESFVLPVTGPDPDEPLRLARHPRHDGFPLLSLTDVSNALRLLCGSPAISAVGRDADRYDVVSAARPP